MALLAKNEVKNEENAKKIRVFFVYLLLRYFLISTAHASRIIRPLMM